MGTLLAGSPLLLGALPAQITSKSQIGKVGIDFRESHRDSNMINAELLKLMIEASNDGIVVAKQDGMRTFLSTPTKPSSDRRAAALMSPRMRIVGSYWAMTETTRALWLSAR